MYPNLYVKCMCACGTKRQELVSRTSHSSRPEIFKEKSNKWATKRKRLFYFETWFLGVSKVIILQPGFRGVSHQLAECQIESPPACSQHMAPDSSGASWWLPMATTAHNSPVPAVQVSTVQCLGNFQYIYTLTCTPVSWSGMTRFKLGSALKCSSDGLSSE